ncbi:condensation domain-containing protein, partial [Methylocapsa aurea]|uniref:condensation domain-containing protein n=1 Tax=Methylocapsa aurea TaxID=663610 RepID=UPI001FDA23BF
MNRPDAAPARSKLSSAKAALLGKRLHGEMAALPAGEAIGPRPPGPPPLSFAQQRLWFLDQLEPASAFYNIPAGFWLKGPLDVAALERSLNEILRRHEALRASFPAIEGQPVQVTAPRLHLTLAAEDLSDLPEPERQPAACAIAREEAARPFDLAAGPLIRVRLLKLACGEASQTADFDYLLVAVLHHIVADAWSIDILIRELAALYPAFAAGRSSPLADLRIHYADYAHWQRGWLTGGVLEGQLAYWRERLAGCDGALDLPADRPRPAVQSHRGGVFGWRLDKSVSRALVELSRREGVTLFMTMLSAYFVLLSRISGQTDLCVGSPVANRNRLETEGLIGLLVNTLVLRADLSGNPSFLALLRRVREAALGAQERQDLPFERLVEELRPERDLGRTPLFQAMFVMQNAPAPLLELGALAVAPAALETMTAKFDLTLTVTEEPEGLTAALDYSADLFEAATIARLAGHFSTLLAGIIASPRARLGDLPLLRGSELDLVLGRWSGA